MKKIVFLTLCCIVFLFINTLLPQSLQTAKPEELGLSTERLENIDKIMQKYVDEKRLSGGVAIVVRDGKVGYLKAFGLADIEQDVKMQPDNLFRIASMTKAVTSVAVMMLYEEGHFLLSDPISKFIPEFKNPQVIVTNPDSTVPAKKEIAIRNLLNHTSGITYQWNEKLGQKYFDAGITHGLIQDEGTIGDMVKKLAKMPLLFHPGEQYHYGLNVDVLGYLVEVVSGKTLDQFFKQRIFAPLGMNDTYFYVPKEKVKRLAAVYNVEKDGSLKKLDKDKIGEPPMVYSADYPFNGPSSFFAGGAGLSSTALDYATFCQMVINYGELNGTRLLSRKTVDLMISNSLGDLSIDSVGNKFGLGFSIRQELGTGELGSVGEYGWGGFWNTTFSIDPEENMIFVFMSQLNPGHSVDLGGRVKVLAYQAIID